MPSVAIIGTRGYPSYYGGFETAVRNLAPYLADRGWAVTVYGRPGATKLDDSTRDGRVRVIETWGIETKSLSTLTFGMTAALHAAREKPDVALVMNCANGYWLPLLRRAGIPTVMNVDGIEWDRAKWGRLAKWMFYRGARMTAKYADRLVFDAHEISRRWDVEFNRDGDYIPYGGDTVSEELPVEEGLVHRGYTLMGARFVPENTVPQFFDAAPAIAEFTDVVLVGSSGYGGELDDRARELAAIHPRIHWYGHINDDRRLFSLWQHAAAYFHGHSVGGTNPALVQAMAMGAPTIARDTPYNREVLRGSGRYVEPNPDSITRAAKALSADREEQNRMSVEGRRRALTHFTWKRVCSLYESSLYRAFGRVKAEHSSE